MQDNAWQPPDLKTGAMATSGLFKVCFTDMLDEMVYLEAPPSKGILICEVL